MFPPEWMVISMSARLAAVRAWGGGHPVGEVAPRPPPGRSGSCRRCGCPRGFPRDIASKAPTFITGTRDHRPREGARVELTRANSAMASVPLLLVAVDPAVETAAPAPAGFRWR